MLIWWVLSLIILVGCGVFTYRMIVSSYEFLPADKRFLFGLKKRPAEKEIFSDSPDPIRILRSKIQHVEDNSTFYHIQFNKFQDRLNEIEDKMNRSFSGSSTRYHDPVITGEEYEEWEKLYYEENEKKEKLENELDATLERLEAAEKKLSSYEHEHESLIKVKSDYDLRSHDLVSMQEKIVSLQAKLDAANEREKELEQVLLSEITIREKYNLLKKDYTKLLSEIENLKIVLASRDKPPK